MKCLAFLFCIFINTICFADAWDNLTHEEAIEVVNYLKANPYIFDYCDCCRDDDDGDDYYKIEMVKVLNARIVECSWDKEFYSVECDYQGIATLKFKEDGSELEIMPPPDPKDEPLTIYMNYTWSFNPEHKDARPMFESIDYHYVAEYGGRSCEEPFAYPSAKVLSSVGKFKGYQQWCKRVGI